MGRIDKLKSFFEYGTLTKIGAKMYTDKNGICELPKRVTKIGEGVFKNKGIKKIIGDNVEIIEKEAFKGCKELKEIELPNIKKIGDFAFIGAGLETIKFSNLEEIGEKAFKGCKELKEVELPNVKKVGDFAFVDAGLETIKFSNLEEIGEEAFKDCKELKKVELLNVKKIGDYAFSNCTQMDDIKGIIDLKKVGIRAFENCENLKAFTPANIENIDNYAFQGCTNLELVNISSVKEELGTGVFFGCNKLRTIVTSERNYKYMCDYKESCFLKQKIDIGYFEGEKWSVPKGESNIDVMITSKDIERYTSEGICSLPKSVVTIRKEAFKDNQEVIKIIGKNVTTIEDEAFNNCINLEEVYLPKVINIGQKAFNSCMKLKEINLPEVMNIGQGAFASCMKLKEINLSEVTSLSNDLFCDCKSLSKASFGKLKTIGEFTFSGCIELTSINGIVELTTVGKKAFIDCEKLEVFTPNDIKRIDDEAFEGCIGLKTVNISNIETLGKNVFKGCNNLNKVYVPESNYAVIHELIAEDLPTKVDSIVCVEDKGEEVKYRIGEDRKIFRKYKINKNGVYRLPEETIRIENEFFKGNENIKGIQGINTTEIGSRAFNNCINLESAEFGKLDKIEEYAFSDCIKLSSITGIKNLKTICEGAFSGCNSLKSFILENVEEIGDKAFKDCTELAKVCLLSPVCQLGEDIFEGCNNLEEIVTSKENYEKLFNYIEKSSLENKGKINIGYLNGTEFYVPKSIDDLKNDFILTKDKVIQYTEKGVCNILEDITKIENEAFKNNQEVTKITGGSIIEIGDSALRNCSKLKSVEFDKIETIGSYAFSESSVETITGTESLTMVNEGVFNECKNLKSIDLSEATRIDNWAFNDCGLEKIDLLKVESIGDYSFFNCESLVDINFGKLESVGKSAFLNCNKLETIKGIKKLKKVGEKAFKNCMELKEFTPESIEFIGDMAFMNCTQLEVVNVFSVKELGTNVFIGCNKLKKVFTSKENCEKVRSCILESLLDIDKIEILYFEGDTYYEYHESKVDENGEEDSKNENDTENCINEVKENIDPVYGANFALVDGKYIDLKSEIRKIDENFIKDVSKKVGNLSDITEFSFSDFSVDFDSKEGVIASSDFGRLQKIDAFLSSFSTCNIIYKSLSQDLRERVRIYCNPNDRFYYIDNNELVIASNQNLESSQCLKNVTNLIIDCMDLNITEDFFSQAGGKLESLECLEIKSVNNIGKGVLKKFIPNLKRIKADNDDQAIKVNDSLDLSDGDNEVEIYVRDTLWDEKDEKR